MKQKQLNIILPETASQEARRFAVELAHLLGFLSISLEFPIVKYPDEPRADDGLIFFVGNGEPSDNFIPVSPDEPLDQLWNRISRICCGQDNRTVKKPKGYISATENAPVTPVIKKTGGLENLFETGWILFDKDHDGLPDHVDCRFVVPVEMDDFTCRAACDLSARLGMETTKIDFPILLDADDRVSNLICFRDSLHPGIVIEQENPRKIIYVEGQGKELERFISDFSNRFPLTAEEGSIADVALALKDTFAMKNPDGQAAAIDAYGIRKALLSPGADLKAFRERWPDSEFKIYNDFYPVETREYDIPWGLETAREVLVKFVYPNLNQGDEIELSGALWENRQQRSQFEQEFALEVKKYGAVLKNAHVLCAYKQGLSWMEEVVAPRAAASGDVRRVVVRFNPVLLPDASSEVAKELEKENKPPRRLQELYPADVLIAPILGITEDDVSFEAYQGNEDITYEALAYDQNNVCLLRETYKTREAERQYLDEFPELGISLPSTGFLLVRKNGEILLDQRIPTDAEQIWDTFQKEILPWLSSYINEVTFGSPSPEMQPFFSRMELEVGIGGPERKIENSTDLISAGELLHENLHMIGQRYFNYYGKKVSGRPFDAPGIILPLIKVRSGKPALKAALKIPFGKEPSIKGYECQVRLRKISAGNNGLELWVEVSDLPYEIAQSLGKLTARGFTQLSKKLSGYGWIHFSDGNQTISAELPPQKPKSKDVCIQEVDLMPDQLIGYEDYLRIINDLRRVEGLNIFKVGQSYQGRAIYAIMLDSKRAGYVSRVKLLQNNPSLLVNGRHHANEVSASNASFALVKELLTRPEYQRLNEELNLIILPVENADGVALHYDLQKDHPDWMFHSSYTNALGADLIPNYFKPDTIHTGAKVITHILETWLPDAMIDLHGVPHHENPEQFNQLNGYKGLWLPRALLCAFYFYVDDPQYASNKALNVAWSEETVAAYRDWPEFARINKSLENRFMKYSWNGINENYPSQWNESLLNYWVPSPHIPQHPYIPVSKPWIMSVLFTAEAADETASGEWLQNCSNAHLRHILAGINLLRNAKIVMEEKIVCKDGGIFIKRMRHRPLLPPDKNENNGRK